jgi:class 3 adenylate cyclase
MAGARVERRLAAILAGDVAGYSRMMGADEEGTLLRLNTHRREFLEPKIAEHRGRIVKRTGDGVLIEFASAVDATRCAVEIKRGMVERNASVPEDKRIELRIGIHIGDVIAARLYSNIFEIGYWGFLAKCAATRDPFRRSFCPCCLSRRIGFGWERN